MDNVSNHIDRTPQTPMAFVSATSLDILSRAAPKQALGRGPHTAHQRQRATRMPRIP